MAPRSILLSLALLLVLPAAARAQARPSDPDEALARARARVKEGLANLRKARAAEGDERTLARRALRSFEEAQELFASYIEKRGATPTIEAEMADLQSLIYWSRKMTPLAEEEPEPEPAGKPAEDPEKDLPGGEGAPPPPEPEPEPAEPPPADRETLARRLFESAERFEREHPGEFLAISARFFEVVDRFRGTEIAARALEKCLDYQKQLLEKLRKTAEPERPAARPDPARPYEAPEDLTLVRLNLRHPEAAIRAANIDALVAALGRKTLPELHGLLLAEKEGPALDRVLRHLCGFRDASTLRFARKASLERSEARARRILLLAERMKRDEYVRLVLIALAVNARRLGGFGTPASQGYVEPIARRVSSAFEGGLRARAVEVLRAMGKEGVAGLRKNLQGRSPVTREAILCLGVLGAHRTAGYVSVFLQRKNRLAFRSEAMASLYLMGIDAVPHLIRNLGNAALRIWSAYTLREMTGQPWSASAVSRWWAWYRAHKR